jgi:hypothetical protein
MGVKAFRVYVTDEVGVVSVIDLKSDCFRDVGSDP